MGQSFDNRGPRLNEMMQALPALRKGGRVKWHGEYYDLPPLMLEPHPQAPVPIYCGGHTDPALKRAARYGDGWIANACPFEVAAHHDGRLKAYLRDDGRDHDPSEIVVGCYDLPTVDRYRRAGAELGVTATLTMPWAGMHDISTGQPAALRESAGRFRGPIERFAEDFDDKCRRHETPRRIAVGRTVGG